MKHQRGETKFECVEGWQALGSGWGPSNRVELCREQTLTGRMWPEASDAAKYA